MSITFTKKEFQRRFGESGDKYYSARKIEKSIQNYLAKYGYEIVFYVANNILSKERQRRNLKKEIEIAEAKLERLKSQKV